jgi:hypothetical protein
MGWRHGVLALSAAALALGACGKPAGDKAASAEGAGKAATATAPAGPMTMPSRKPGLWQQTVTTTGMQQVSSICLDKASEAKLSVWGTGASKDMCQQSEISPVPGGWAFKSSCDMGTGGKTVSHGTITGDFDSSYKLQAESTTEGAGAPQMNGAHMMSMEATWEGPCPPDMKPGDMTLPGGMKINMLDMASGHSAMVRPPSKH